MVSCETEISPSFVLFVFVGAQFIGMGLLGEYLGRVYHDVRARPRYFIRRTIGNPKSDNQINQRIDS